MLNTRKVSLQLPCTVELAGDYRLRYSLKYHYNIISYLTIHDMQEVEQFQAAEDKKESELTLVIRN